MSAERAGTLVATSFLVTFMAGAPLRAATYYVKSGGNDASAGTSAATAWAHCPGMSNATGVAASTRLQSGDSVLFARGDTFTAPVANPWLDITTSGTATHPITFGAYGTGALPKLDGHDNSGNLGVVRLNGVSYVTVDSLDIYHGTYMSLYVLAPSAGASSTGIKVENSAFHDNGRAGWPPVVFQGNGTLGCITQVVFEGNDIYSYQHDGVKFAEGVTHVDIADDTIHDGGHDGIDTLSDSGLMYESSFTIHDNEIYDVWGNDGPTATAAGGRAMYLPGLHDSEVYDNVMHDMNTAFGGGSGIAVTDQNFVPANVTIHNNVFYGFPGGTTAPAYAIVIDAASTTDFASNVWNNTIVDCYRPDYEEAVSGLSFANNLAYACSSDGTAISNASADPLFVDPTSTPPDFHLRAGSPAIDAGVDVGLPYNGSAPDLGAFEYVAPPRAPTNLRVVP